MKKIIHLIFIITFNFLLLTTYLYSQSGWSEDTQLVYLPGTSWYPRAACNGDTIHLVWWQHYAHDEVFYKRSTDAGETWGDDELLTPEDSISAVTPSIAVWSNNVHVAWKESYTYYYAICYRKSTDGGNTWSIIDTLHKTNMEGMRGNPRLCVYSDTVCLVTTRDDGNILFMKSTDNGVSWDSADVIGDGAAHPSFKMSKSISFYLTLSVAASEITEILFYKSTDAGETWSDSQVISENDGIGSQRPAMDTDDSSGIHITWYDYKYSPYPWTGDIFYRASRDSGNTWEQIDSLTVEHRTVASDILAEGNNVHLVWEDDRHGFNNNFEIYYRMSTDLGQTWGSEVRLTDALYHSYCPSLACGIGYLHLFWQDRRNDSNNITGKLYYKRKSLSGAVSEFYHQKDISEFLTISPNPFKEKTLITFFLSEHSGFLEVYDVSGRGVFGKQVSGKGRKEVLWQTNNAGVYFVTLKTKNKVAVKKIVALK